MSTKLEINTSLLYVNFINICTHSSEGKIQGNPKMSSTLHNEFNFFQTTSFFANSTCLLAIKRWYSTCTFFARENMEIHEVFGLWGKNTYNVFNKNSNWHTKSSAKSVNTIIFILWAKQWTLLKKGATFYLNCNVTLVWLPWKTLLS
jgi:hypothetical protein